MLVFKLCSSSEPSSVPRCSFSSADNGTLICLHEVSWSFYFYDCKCCHLAFLGKPIWYCKLGWLYFNERHPRKSSYHVNLLYAYLYRWKWVLATEMLIFPLLSCYFEFLRYHIIFTWCYSSKVYCYDWYFNSSILLTCFFILSHYGNLLFISFSLKKGNPELLCRGRGRQTTNVQPLPWKPYRVEVSQLQFDCTCYHHMSEAW